MMDWSSSSSSSSVRTCSLSALYQFPSNYKLVSFLGRGGFGEVFKCIKEDTKETVAVKIPQHGCNLNSELSLLNFFMRKNLDKCNIVRFIDSFILRDNRVAMAFEMLDVTLKDYIFYQRDFTPLDLHEVRSVVQQMATALNALKTFEVIHSDIKLDNIMLVDGEAQPLRVKLIDFGLAFPTCRGKQGTTHQITHYRAPEIILGLPFSEAIDMWSLGVVMAFMVLGDALFPGNSEYDAMRCIVDLLGVPPDHLLSAGRYSNNYFVRSSSHWRLKTPQEYWRNNRPAGDFRAYQFRNLDDVEELPLKNLNMVVADEKKECIDLLKAMLRMDANERITPSQALAHPFITRGTIHHSSDNETLESRTSHTTEPGPSETADPGTTQANETKASKTTDCTLESLSWEEELVYETCSSSTSGFHGWTPETSHPGVLLVRPAPAERCLRWDEDSGQQSEACSLGQLEDLSENSPVAYPRGVKSDPPPPPFVLEDLHREQEHTQLTATTPDDTEPEKKKKNSIKRFFSWMKRTFCGCISVDNDEG